jgi:hypothetical protein
VKSWAIQQADVLHRSHGPPNQTTLRSAARLRWPSLVKKPDGAVDAFVALVLFKAHESCMSFVGKKQFTQEEAVEKRDSLKDAKGSLQELSDMDMAQLRQFLEQKTQLEQMISNIMKAGAESQASLVANLKGS